MTQQKAVKWINVNSILTAICTAVIFWVGKNQVQMYDALLLQPKIDEVQTAEIKNIATEVQGIKSVNEDIKSRQTRMDGRLIYIEAILPDPDQFKIKK